MLIALRRVVWLIPTLLGVTVAAFWLLSHLAPETAAAPSSLHTRALPRFLNLSPGGVDELATSAALRVASDGASARQAAGILERTGAAAFPYVLPLLDTLPPKGRARLALALAPVARRMGVSTREDLADGEGAVVFWSRFWQDHAIDFRPAAAKRAVHRAAEHASPLRRTEVVQLDTFALPYLVAAMREAHEDVERARRLTELAAHCTGLDWVVPPGATAEKAAAILLEWQTWWRHAASSYVVFQGPHRIAAMITETRYGRWATEIASRRLGTTHDGRPVLDVLVERAPVTLWLVAAGILGSYLVGALLGTAFLLRRRIDLAASAVCTLAAALPLAAFSALFAPGDGGARPTVAALLMVVLTAALVSRHQRVAMNAVLEQDFLRAHRALGAPPWQVARRAFRTASSSLASLLGVELPAMVTASFVVEHGLGLRGLGEVTVAAARSGDVAWLMVIALTGALGVGLGQILSDMLLILLDPRARWALEEREGARP